MQKMNNKGYMLVEIILAFAIAFTLVYFMMNMVIKLKNKNDDSVVRTVVTSDQVITTNKLMDYVINDSEDDEIEFDCNALKDGINVSDGSIKYNDTLINVINEDATIDKDNFKCSTDLGKVSIIIPIKVEQLPDDNFDVVIEYKYDIGDNIKPICNMSANGSKVTVTYSDNKDGNIGSGVIGYYFGTDNPSTTNVTYTDVSPSKEEATYEETELSDGTYYFSVKDKANLIENCSVIIDTTAPTCTISVSSSNVNGSSSDTGSGLEYYGWNSSYSGTNSTEQAFSTGTNTYYAKDKAGNKNKCSLEVKAKIKTDGEYCAGSWACSKYNYYQSTSGGAGCNYNGANAQTGQPLYTCSTCISTYCTNWVSAIYGCPSGYSAIPNNSSYCYK